MEKNVFDESLNSLKNFLSLEWLSRVQDSGYGKNLVAYYPFEGNANDLSGNENNGVVIEANLNTGKIGQSYNFNGLNSYINLGSSPSLNLINAITVSAWIKIPSYATGSDWHNIINRRVSSPIHDQYSLVFSPDYKNIAWSMQYNSSLNSFYLSSGDINLNTWHYVVGTFDGNKAYLYIDGIQVNSASISIMPTGHSGNTLVGALSLGPGMGYFNGTIDEIKIWDYALNLDEINLEYQRGLQCNSSCGGNCGTCPIESCIPDWHCSDWSSCVNLQQTRTCSDDDNCNTNNTKPNKIQSCTITELPLIDVKWTKYQKGPLMEIGSSGTWEDYISPGDVYIFDEDNLWHMIYFGYSDKTDLAQTGYATSTNLIDWVKYDENPVMSNGLSGSWDEKFTHKAILAKKDNIYYMFYDGQDNLREKHIGIATSTDLIQWTKHPTNPNPILDEGPAPIIEKDGMWYMIGNKVFSSKDLINWQIIRNQPYSIPTGPEGSWDDSWVYPGSCIIKVREYYIMSYIGSDSPAGTTEAGYKQTGLAYSKNLINWVKYPNNPIFGPDITSNWDNESSWRSCLIKDEENYYIFYNGGGGNPYREQLGLYIPIEKELIAYYPLDLNTNDASRNSNNGTNNFATPTTGKIGGAYSFNGVNSYINITSPLNLNNVWGFSISAWVKPATANQANKWIVAKGKWGNDINGDWFLTTQNPSVFGFGVIGSSPLGISSSAFSKDNWYLLFGIYNGTEINIYIDGVKVSNAPANGLDLNFHDILIGGESSRSAMFNGSIDEVKIWNYALNESEINQEYLTVVSECTSNSNCVYMNNACNYGICNNLNKCEQRFNSSATVCRVASGNLNITENCTRINATCRVDVNKTDKTTGTIPDGLNKNSNSSQSEIIKEGTTPIKTNSKITSFSTIIALIIIFIIVVIIIIIGGK